MRCFVLYVAFCVWGLSLPVSASEGTDVVSLYDFEISASFSTDELVSETLPSRWTGRIERSLARVFRDGSMGWRVYLDEVQAGTVDEMHPSSLTAKAFEMRTFPTGEVLRLVDFDHLAGADRDGELLTPLWWSLSPLPPALKPGRSAMRRSVFPLIITKSVGIRFQATLDWTYVGKVREPTLDKRKLLHLTYQGSVQPMGRESGFLSPVQVTGEVNGELWVHPKNLEVLRHDVDWTLTYRVPDEEDFGWQTHQQELSVRLERKAVRPRTESEARAQLSDQQRLPLYLDEDRVRATLHQRAEVWSPCFASGPVAPEPTPVRISVGADGKIRSVTGDDDKVNSALFECLRSYSDAISFPVHHEEIETFRYVLVWREGQVQPYPSVEFERRDFGKLFVRPSVVAPPLVD